MHKIILCSCFKFHSNFNLTRIKTMYKRNLFLNKWKLSFFWCFKTMPSLAVVYNCFIWGNWSSNDEPTRRHFACSLKKEYAGYCGKLSRVRESWLYLLEVLLCSPLFSRTDTLPFPPALSAKKPTVPHSGKLPTVTDILFFQTAYKMTSHWCAIAGPVSANKTIIYYSCSVTFFLFHAIVQFSRKLKCSKLKTNETYMKSFNSTLKDFFRVFY